MPSHGPCAGLPLPMPSGHVWLNVAPITCGISGLLWAGRVLSSPDHAGPELAACAGLTAWLGLGWLCAGLAIVFDRPALYCKRRDGTLPGVVWLYLGSWLLVYRGCHLLKWLLPLCGLRWKRGDREFDLVAPRLLLGRLLWQLPTLKGVPEVRMVIDMTCEWTEPWALRNVEQYLAVPVVDTTRPTTEQAAFAARRAVHFLRDPDAGSVYVHCANGYGRSAVVAAAVLLLDGTCREPAEAKAAIMRARPVVSLRERQQKSVCEVATHMEILEAIANEAESLAEETDSVVDPVSSSSSSSSEEHTLC